MADGKLNALKVSRAKPGRYGDGRGLWLAVSPTGSQKWIFRFTFDGKVREMGIRAETLAQARIGAQAAREMVADNINPIEVKRAAKAQKKKPTFAEMAAEYIAANEGSWRNPKHAEQWRMTTGDAYCAAIRQKPVDQIGTEDVLLILRPIWMTKAETASRLRGRIEAILDAARAKGLREGDNPARLRGHLDKLLGKRQRLMRGHHAAMDYADVPAFVERLREREALAALALEMTVLTACRTSEVLNAQWAEVDLETKVWTIPAPRMKAGKEHRVPLCDRAVAIFEKLAEAKADDALVFPGQRRGKPLSNMAMAMVMRRMGVESLTVHGFRSAFRDWAGNETSFPREVAEQCLAHAIGDETERAYRRADALEKRRALMTAWANYIKPKTAGSNVVPLARVAS